MHSINDKECNDRRVDDMGRNRKKTYECYIDYITCDLDPNSPSLEEYIKLDQMDEDLPHIDDMLPTTISEGGNRHYSHDDFAFFDRGEEHENLIRRNSVQKSHCQNQLYFYQKYIHKAKRNCDDTDIGQESAIFSTLRY